MRWTVFAIFLATQSLPSPASAQYMYNASPNPIGGGYTISGPGGITNVSPNPIGGGYTMSGPDGITNVRPNPIGGGYTSVGPGGTTYTTPNPIGGGYTITTTPYGGYGTYGR